MQERAGSSIHRKLTRVRRYILEGGERFATVVDVEGAPAYYPTCFLLGRRRRSASVETLAAAAHDLIHLGLWEIQHEIDLQERIEAGRHLTDAEAESLADTCSLKTRALRRVTSTKVRNLRKGASLTKDDLIGISGKERRLTTITRYLELVCEIVEANAPPRSAERARVRAERKRMLAQLALHRAKMVSSRIRGQVPASASPPSPGFVTRFVIDGILLSAHAARFRRSAQRLHPDRGPILSETARGASRDQK